VDELIALANPIADASAATVDAELRVASGG